MTAQNNPRGQSTPVPPAAPWQQAGCKKEQAYEADLAKAENLNYWRRYRDPQAPELTPHEAATTSLRPGPYIPSRRPGTPPPLFRERPPLRPPGPPNPIDPLSVEQIAFIDGTPPDFTSRLPEDPKWPNLLYVQSDQPQWKGRRLLGEGTYAKAGLWDWTGPASAKAPKKRQVVVKELKIARTLKNEGDKMQELNVVQSIHIVQIYAQPRKVDRLKEGLPIEWENKVKRLLIEYCPHGELWDLTRRRQLQSRPYTEYTLWCIFKCLIDGISVLEYGNEVTFDPTKGEYNIRRQEQWIPIVHFDLKPENILMGNRGTGHSNTPVFKIADFGHARYIHSDLAWETKNTYRNLGTRSYFAPERFSERWDYNDFQQSEVCGNYNKTNLFQAGLIMQQLVRLRCNPPDVLKLLNPPEQPKTLQSAWKGLTYGVNITNYPYGNTLTELIIECLYENPSHRPDLMAVKIKIMRGIGITGGMNGMREVWSTFVS